MSDKDVYKRQFDFWKEHLGTSIRPLELPTDRRRRPQAQGSSNTARCSHPLVITPSVLKLFSDAHRTSTADVLLAVYFVLLFRYCGEESQKEINIGTNSGALRRTLLPTMPFEELMKQVNSAHRIALAGPYEAFAEVLRDLVDEQSSENRHRRGRPPFQTALRVNTRKGRERHREAEPPTEELGLDLSLGITINNDGDGLIMVDAEYNVDLFDGSTVARMVSHFEQILCQVLSQPNQTVSAIPLMGSKEQDNLLALSGILYPYAGPSTLKELFEQRAARNPNAIAVEDADGTRALSYADLDAQSNMLARKLWKEYGVGSDVAVGLSAERTIETMVSMLAILKAGGAYVPLSTTLPAARLQQMVVDADLAVVLCGEDASSTFQSLEGVALLTVRQEDFLADGPFASQPASALMTTNQSRDLAYIIFTSGTTGTPKGVMVSNGAVTRYIDAMNAIEPLEASDRVLQIMALTFDMSISDIWFAWAFGGTLVLCHEWTALDGLSDFIQTRSISVLGCTPTQLSVMSPDEVPALRLAVVAGEAISAPLIHTWSSHSSCKLYNRYGPTEAAVTVTSVHCTPQMTHPTSIGRPNPGSVKVYILDPQDQLVPIGVPGQLHIAGPQLARGYMNQAELTASKFIANPYSCCAESDRLYRTGDRCRWLADGSIEYLGRIDSQVKLRGFRIELEEIEHRILEHEGIRSCVVALKHRGADGCDPFLAAYVVVKHPAQPLNLPTLHQLLTDNLPEYMIPAAFVKLDEIPRDRSGKTDRRKLPTPQPHHFLVLGHSSGSNSNEKLTEIQRHVRNVFGEVLGFDPSDITLNDNFFQLGGQSLMATRLLSLVRRRFGTKIGFADFFSDPTIRNVAARATTGCNDSTFALTPRDHTDMIELPLSAAQRRMYFLYQLNPKSSLYNVSSV